MTGFKVTRGIRTSARKALRGGAAMTGFPGTAHCPTGSRDGPEPGSTPIIPGGFPVLSFRYERDPFLPVFHT